MITRMDDGTRFSSVLDFIESSLDLEVGLSELASIAGLSVARFAHAFKASHGIAPYRYVIERRIAHAKMLLRTSDDTIAAIAAQVGFPSQSRFGQLFARAVGTTPSSYRLARW